MLHYSLSIKNIMLIFLLMSINSINLFSSPKSSMSATPAKHLFTCDNGGQIGDDQTICFGDDPEPITNIDPASCGGAIQYLWMSSIPGVSGYAVIPGATDPSYDPPALSQTTVFIRCARQVGDPDYIAESNSVTIEVLAGPYAFFTNASSTIFSFETATFSVSGSPNVSYFWNFGDGTTAGNSSTVNHNYSAPGFYTVTLKVTDNITGCITCLQTDITVLDNSLPVELSVFESKLLDNNEVLLSWTTLSERNNFQFEIEKSLDGEQFYVIGTIAGQGDSDKESLYSFIDETPAYGTNYYRLKQIDLDRQFSFSDITAVQYAKDNNTPLVSIYPNPAVSELSMLLEDASALDVEVTIYNTNHSIVATYIIPANSRKLNVNTQDLSPGFYVARVNAREFRTALPFVKIN